MKTLDLKKQFKHLYEPSAKKVELVQIPSMNFIRVDGAIEKGSSPGESPSFADATAAIYGISYTLKFMLKKAKTDPIDYPVMALEGLWWVEDGFFDIQIKDNWLYTLMIMVPDLITSEVFSEAMMTLKKKKGDLPVYQKLRLAPFEEGLCVQTMHIGPYATEPATLDVMREFMKENGVQDLVGLGGKHHEIYIGDPRKSAPDKLKTVLRHPVARNS
jgi:hypothetical protein